MKKVKLILGAALLAGVAYAAGQNFTVIVNGQVSDLQGVVVNNRLYVPADVLPDLGIRISAAPGVLSLSSDAGGGSRGSVSVTTPSTVVTGGSPVRSRDYKSQGINYGDLSFVLNKCYKAGRDEVFCDFTAINNGNDTAYYLYANSSNGVSRVILEDGTEIISTGARVANDKDWQGVLNKVYRSQITYNIQIKFSVPGYVSSIKYLDIYFNTGSINAKTFRITDVTIE